nr:hypothetical protein [Tanacetum cinerariifolium]
MEMLFTINLRPHPMVNANIIFKYIPSSLIPIQDNDSQRKEIDIVTNTNEVLPLGFENDDSEGEIDVVDELHVDNSISNSEHELSDDEASDFDNPESEDTIFDPERIKREHADYINRMEMLLTINLRPHPTVNANIIFEYIPSSLIPIQDNDSQRKEIDIVTNTNEVLPLGFENDDSEGEIDAVDELHVDNSISNYEHELSDDEASDFDNPSIPLPPPEPPD